MPKRPAKSPARPALSRDDIVHLVGDVDDAVITGILSIGASYVEVEEAVKWASGNAEDLAKEHHELSPRAEAVYDILVTEPAFLGAEHER